MKRLAFLLALFIPFAAQAGLFGDDKKCVVGGCSSQLCVDANAEPVVSTCEWTEAYGCYAKYGECKEQEDGKCGWTQSEALLHCLTYPKREPMTVPDSQETPSDVQRHKPLLNP